VVILDRANDSWYRVAVGGKIGYVAARYVKDVGTVKNFTAAGIVSGSDVRLRNGPSTDSDVLQTYASGEAVSVIGINNGWLKISDGEKTGYIRSDFVSLATGADGADRTSDTAKAAAADAAAVEAAEPVGQKIADYAKQFAGSKYIYGASSPNVGFDCSGLTYYVYGQFGYPISRTASKQYKNNGTAVSKADLLPGDLVFFSSNGGYSVTHVGLYIGDDQFVNASTSRTGVIISSLTSSWYSRTWYGAKRIVE
jgi:cell wall-associated NlpC family hydrolase